MQLLLREEELGETPEEMMERITETMTTTAENPVEIKEDPDNQADREDQEEITEMTETLDHHNMEEQGPIILANTLST